MHCLIITFFTIVSLLLGKCDYNSNNSKIDYKLHFNQNNSDLYIDSMNHNKRLAPDLSLHMITWNVKSEHPKCDLTQLLNIHTSADTGGQQVADNPSGDSLADLYVIGLQEVPFRPSNIFFTDPWVDSFDQIFKQITYIRLKSVRMVGILLLIYTKRQDLPKFRSIETSYTRTGFGGLWGNKGGVSVSLVIDGVSLCLVNSHLPPHDEWLDKRITDYNTIVDDQYFVSTRKPNILSHDYVIWIGDLNFRIDDLSGDEIHDIILNAASAERTASSSEGNRFARLLEKDQLNRVRREGQAFSEFTETEPTFAPTYKFLVNTNSYDYKSRKPAYTDRILYRFTANAYEDIKLELKQSDYKSIPQYKQSDHKPVLAKFQLKTRKHITGALYKRSIPAPQSLGVTDPDTESDGGVAIAADEEEDIYVTFHPITDWSVNQDSTAWYTITPNNDHSIAQLSAWDWIGLYQSDFISIDEHLAFVWVNPEPSRWSPPPVHQTDSSSQSSEEESGGGTGTDGARQPWFSVQFLDQNLLASDEFRLVYVTQNGDVLGISEPFLVTND